MKKKSTFSLLMSTAVLSLSLSSCGSANLNLPDSVVQPTGAIRNVVPAQINGKPMVYISEIDGTVSLNSLSGEQSWRNPTDKPAVMFEILAKDIDGDSNDDLIGVSASGAVYAWKSSGELLWKFTTDKKTRLVQAATIGSGADTKIFAGGNDYQLYELDANGKLLSTTPISGSVLYVESGDFVEDGKESLLVLTLSHDKFRSQFFGFIDPVTKKVIKESKIESVCPAGSYMVNDMAVADVDKDGRDDIIIAGHAGMGIVYVGNGELENILTLEGDKSDAQRYSHAFCAPLMPAKEQIVMQFGGVMRLFDLAGKEIDAKVTRHSGIIYNGLVAVPSEDLLIGTGQIGGDNTLYYYDLNDENWVQKEHQFGGLYSEVQNNINTLYEQALNFKRPDYQTKEENEFVVLGLSERNLDPKVKALTEGKVTFLTGGGGFSEDTDRSHLVKAIGENALLKDKRRKYQDKREDIVAAARAKEKAGVPFEMWVGHGTDPFFVQIETIEQMIAAAPTTCRGLVYAEMANTSDPRVGYFVENYMPRIAKAIRDNKADTKLYFRYKNMFWAADVHEPIWKELFLSGKYSDIVVPSAEDTNNRLQDLNLSGRVGMYMSGAINNYAMRLVDDNPTSWRPYAPGGQRSVSPYLRNAALTSAYGSRHGLLFSIAYLEKPGYNAFFALNNSGLIPDVQPDDILSVGSWMLVDNIDQEYLERVNNGHDLIRYRSDDDNAVASVAGVHWCGADIPEHDYSRIASGAEYRWLNFIPTTPNGMVPIAESKYATTLKKQGVDYVVTNINEGIVDGKKVDGKAFGTTLKNSVEKGGKTMLMRVDGASWALYRVGKNHARLLLLDQGYVDPAERTATITLQNEMPLSAKDILSGETFATDKGTITLKVPAGSMRFIDFEYKSEL
ncbi:MAG: hypothetical protein R3Y50_00040 [Rikenellaceae bacterium]